MTDALQFLDVESGAGSVRIAVRAREGEGPAIVWLGGFMSDMASTKAGALDAFAAKSDRRFVRFDYSGHGESGGRFVDGTIGAWLEQSLAVIARFAGPAPVLVGSSMGGWIALLATLKLRASASPLAPSGLALIAPAVDFTESLMWAAMSDDIRRQILEKGQWLRPSQYSETPYPITRGLIEEGRRHLLLGKPLETGCPVHILQGALDPDVPMSHALKLVEHLPHDPVNVTIIPDGEHRLSRDQDIAKLVEIVARLADLD